MQLSNAYIIKECRYEARKYGLVFRKSNCSHLWLFHDRKTKEVILSNLTLGSAYNHVCSGYISCYDKTTQDFNKDWLRNLGLID